MICADVLVKLSVLKSQCFNEHDDCLRVLVVFSDPTRCFVLIHDNVLFIRNDLSFLAAQNYDAQIYTQTGSFIQYLLSTVSR